MIVESYDKFQLAEALKTVGLERDCLVYLPSALFALGRMDGVGLGEIPEQIFDVVLDIIGPNGTLTVPASFEDYARHGTPYDTHRSDVDAGQGVFSQYVAKLPNAYRSYCPLNAVAGVGPLAEEVCHSWTGSSYGVGSAWDKLYEHDAIFLFLGIAPNQAFNFAYYVQHRFGVPHLYNKLYTTPVFSNGERVELAITSSVRYLDSRFRIIENAKKFEDHLQERAIVRKAPIGRGYVYALPSAQEVFDIAVSKLQEDIYYFLDAPPNFTAGEIPMDGNTGAMKTDRERFD